MKRVNILGTEYRIIESDAKEKPILKDAAGFCDSSVKEIYIDRRITDKAEDSKANLESVKRKVLRHEIIHAFFSESGLEEQSDYAVNEELVDWIAIQYPKINDAFRSLGIDT